MVFEVVAFVRLVYKICFMLSSFNYAFVFEDDCISGVDSLNCRQSAYAALLVSLVL